MRTSVTVAVVLSVVVAVTVSVNFSAAVAVTVSVVMDTGATGHVLGTDTVQLTGSLTWIVIWLSLIIAEGFSAMGAAVGACPREDHIRLNAKR